ncbi:MAG: MotA/TolQ/ExbB proton channel family protein [Planctomycetaceae bacterium]|nr:MotA/TolQ/ExbB proton channel family protein [Planctomycetaceae bacterium]
MNYTQILDIAGKLIYVVLGLSALAGVFLVILLILRIAQKRFSSLQAELDFSENVRDLLAQRDLEGLTNYCDSPELFSKAAPQLVLLAIANPQPPQRMRQFLSEKFERDVLADIDYRSQWVTTIVKSAPMLGLLGTVIGMINAFAKIAAMKETGMDPSVLAQDISFALFTTAMGLSVAIPLVMAGAAINIRVGKLQDSVQHTIGDFLATWESQLSSREGDS